MDCKLPLIIAGMLISATVNAAYDYPVSKKACARIDSKIEKIDRKLKAGYSVRKGEILKDKLRTLKNQRYDCKQKRFSVN